MYPRANSQAPFQLSPSHPAFFTGRDKEFSAQPKKRGAPFFPGPDQQRLRFLEITYLLSQTERRWSVEIWTVEWRPRRSITAQPTPESRCQNACALFGCIYLSLFAAALIGQKAGLRAWASPRVANWLASEQKTFVVVFLVSRLLVVCVLCGADKISLAMAEEECCNFQPISIPVSSFNISLKFRTRFASDPWNLPPAPPL